MSRIPDADRRHIGGRTATLSLSRHNKPLKSLGPVVHSQHSDTSITPSLAEIREYRQCHPGHEKEPYGRFRGPYENTCSPRRIAINGGDRGGGNAEVLGKDNLKEVHFVQLHLSL